MIRIFSDDECDSIYNREMLTLEEKAIIVNNINSQLNLYNYKMDNVNNLKIGLKKNYTEQKTGWHLDSIVVNFIICIKEPGTFILNTDTNEIMQLKKGYGYLLVGTKGSANYNLKQSYHTSPLTLNDRCLIICEYNHELCLIKGKPQNKNRNLGLNFQLLTATDSFYRLPESIPEDCPNYDLYFHYGYDK